jgi:hypothetical protein
MKLKYLLVCISIATLIVGGSDKTTVTSEASLLKNTSTSKELSSEINKKSIIRAEGISKFGKIIITPSSEEIIGQLGVDSSYGRSSDYKFNADYNIVFIDSHNNKKIIGAIKRQNIPAIIQPKKTPVKMEKLKLSGNEIFIYLPQYSGSNDVPLYAFSVNKKGEAFQLSFQYDVKAKPIKTASIITTTSKNFTLPLVDANRLIIRALMNDTTNSPDLKLYKLTFKLSNNILLLTSKSLVN